MSLDDDPWENEPEYWLEPEDPADEAYSDWLDEHQHDDFDLGWQFRAEVDAELERQRQAWQRHLAACADFAA